ncbi:hypothetical protein C2W64_00544 [Brevibacillus laterosporus]|nr:hypothetical protein C2W64_00544 [Brevibacillus laterosporus]
MEKDESLLTLGTVPNASSTGFVTSFSTDAGVPPSIEVTTTATGKFKLG